jgi:hypothetical protein
MPLCGATPDKWCGGTVWLRSATHGRSSDPMAGACSISGSTITRFDIAIA